MNIKNGIVQVENIKGIPFYVDLIPITNHSSRPQFEIKPEYITIHNTGNDDSRADADMHTEYVDTTNDYISWHFTVDDKKIYQELPIYEIGYHCSDGNFKSIGIEICETGDYAKAEENAINLIIFLMQEMNVGIDKIVPHQFWSGKYCPHLILDAEGGFERFKERIENKMTLIELKNQTPDEIIAKAFDSSEAWIDGCDFAEEFGKIDGVGKGYILQYMRAGFKKAYLLGLEDGNKLN